jgi:integrase
MKGHLTRRGARSWRLKYDVEAEIPGQARRTRYVTLRAGNRRNAQRAAAKIMAAVATGEHVDPARDTVANFVERWLKDWADSNISNKTFTHYSGLLRRHLCSRFGTLPLQKLTAAHLQRAYAEMAKGGLSDRTRLNLHRVVHTMLKHATPWDVVARNVATLLDSPKVKQRKIEVLDSAQVQRVLETLRGRASDPSAVPLYPIVALAISTGLRRGELLALRWQDVALDASVLKVEGAVEETTRGGRLIKAPKTRHGRRQVTLPAATVTVLREHWRTQQEQRLFFGLGKAPPNAFVFANLAAAEGDIPSPHALTQAWRKAMRKLGIKATFHSLRHTHASTLIAGGMDVLSISRRLGHGSAVITLSTYAHLLKPDDRAAAIMEAALAGREQ